MLHQTKLKVDGSATHLKNNSPTHLFMIVNQLLILSQLMNFVGNLLKILQRFGVIRFRLLHFRFQLENFRFQVSQLCIVVSTRFIIWPGERSAKVNSELNLNDLNNVKIIKKRFVLTKLKEMKWKIKLD